jgi:hypothetical protein
MTMRVLVTGSSGLIGSAVVTRLRAERDDVVSFDIADGHDMLYAPGVAAAAVGCDAIVHAAGAHADTEDSGVRYITGSSSGRPSSGAPPACCPTDRRPCSMPRPHAARVRPPGSKIRSTAPPAARWSNSRRPMS